MKAVTGIELECSQGRQTFELEHAERILRTQNGGWWLPKDSQYIFDLTNGISRAGNTGKTKEASKE